MKKSVAAFAITAALVGTGGGALAFAPGIIAALHNCQNAGLQIKVRLEACTAIIKTNLLTPHVLAALYATRGYIYAVDNELDAALADYNRAIALKPDFPQALVNRAVILDQQKEYAKAMPDFDYASRLQPDVPNAFVGSCFDRAMLGKEMDTALAICDKALQLEPTNLEIHENRALVLLRLGRCQDAMPDFDAAIAANRRSWLSLYGRGICKSKTGDASGGQIDIAAAVILNSQSAQQFASMGLNP